MFNASCVAFYTGLVAGQGEMRRYSLSSIIGGAMIKVYFDKNVLSHILASQRGAARTNDVTTNDLAALREAVAERKIVNLLSPMHLQEAVSALNAPSPDVAQEELQLILDLMETRQILKFPNDLLTHDIFSYARRESSSWPLVRNYHDLDELFSHGGDVDKRKEALAETVQQNEDFLTATTNATDNDREFVLEEFGGQKPTFEDFYAKKVPERILGLIEGAQRYTRKGWLIKACKERGIDGMLKVSSIAVAAGASLSYQYARIFSEISRREDKRRGDAPDLGHALLASAADVFVTHDKDFASWFRRIPHKSVEVLDHVHKLVEQIG
jgi:hypothetical protein